MSCVVLQVFANDKTHAQWLVIEPKVSIKLYGIIGLQIDVLPWAFSHHHFHHLCCDSLFPIR